MLAHENPPIKLLYQAFNTVIGGTGKIRINSAQSFTNLHSALPAYA